MTLVSLNTTDMAAALNVSVATLQRLRKASDFPVDATRREGVTTFWQVERVKAYIATRKRRYMGRPSKLLPSV